MQGIFHEAGDLSARRSAGGQVSTYDYDSLGNLRSVRQPDGTRIDYLIDPANRRIGKKNGVLQYGLLRTVCARWPN